MNYNIKKWGKLEQKTKPKNYDLGSYIEDNTAGIGSVGNLAGDVLSSTGTGFGTIGGSALKGVAAGAALGPVGMLVGGGLGLIGGLFSNKKRKEAEAQQKEILNKQKLISKQQQMNAFGQSGGGLPGAGSEVFTSQARIEQGKKAKIQGMMKDFSKHNIGNILAMGGYLTPETLAKSGIYIKPSKRGTFTAAATKHGKSVQGFASQVLANKENYSPAMVKKANFAKNASKFKHALGGPEGDPEQGLNTTTQSYTPSDKTQWFSSSAALSKYKMLMDQGNKDEANKIIMGYYANENFGPYQSGTHSEYKNTGRIYPVTADELLGIDTKKYPKPKDYEVLSEYLTKNLKSGKMAEGGYIKGGLVNPLSTQYGSIVGYNSGGTHNQNPLGGIPLSKAPTGEQNTVEQGETSFKFKNGKYIFSNRLKVKK